MNEKSECLNPQCFCHGDLGLDAIEHCEWCHAGEIPEKPQVSKKKEPEQNKVEDIEAIVEKFRKEFIQGLDGRILLKKRYVMKVIGKMLEAHGKTERGKGIREEAESWRIQRMEIRTAGKKEGYTKGIEDSIKILAMAETTIDDTEPYLPKNHKIRDRVIFDAGAIATIIKYIKILEALKNKDNG